MNDTKVVWLGTRAIMTGVATHWAVRIGGHQKEKGDWYELDGVSRMSQLLSSGSSLSNNMDDNLNRINGSMPGPAFKSIKSKLGAGDQIFKVGQTEKTNDEIQMFNIKYLDNNPTYNILDSNCQVYAEKLIKWLTDDCFILPETDLQYFSGWKWRLGSITKNVLKRVASGTRRTIHSGKSQLGRISNISKSCVLKAKATINSKEIKSGKSKLSRISNISKSCVSKAKAVIGSKKIKPSNSYLKQIEFITID